MVLPSMHLLENPAHARLVAPDYDEQVFHDKADRHQFVDHLDMSEALLVRANFILTFRNQDSTGTEDPMRLLRSAKIEIKDGFVIFLFRIRRAVVDVIELEILMVLMRCSSGRMHIGRIEHNAVE